MSEKTKVGVLGATGSVGQKFIQMLENHPYFEVTEVAASERSQGKKYRDAVNWILTSPIPESVAALEVKKCEPSLDCRVVFSGLDASVAGEIETDFARAGYVVVSNSKNHRFDADVPLLIPEVNPDHLGLVKIQPYGKGAIVTNPNCSTIGLVIALKPLVDRFGLDAVNVVTMQAVSGAGYPGVATLDIYDNVVPFIGGEEAKVESEPLKILGTLLKDHIELLPLKISAQCNRVPVIDGHTETVQVSLKRKATKEEIIDAWRTFRSVPQELNLPFAPQPAIYYFDQENYPQPRKHRDLGRGMAVSVGRLRECTLFDWKFVVMSHNTARGAAGGAILCAELMKGKGML
ncbi:MAG: aspartate-semialdehyde dehydrogenase [Ignavibacteriales bacterium]|nr:aspartate-semialdehyde dehydrogenase [Ignavibacteriales bacterium]